MKKVLIIEDQIKLSDLLTELLSLLGYAVTVASNGIEGLEQTRNESPDIILCDIMMPKMDGYTFLQEHLKSEFKNTPVIFVSAKIGIDDENYILKLGAKALMQKPYEINELNKLIKKNLKNSV
ncbi:MAG: response regulator [Flavobacteriaceae bacterium]|nr:response regulator [Flavobacteriaceae bacterium]